MQKEGLTSEDITNWWELSFEDICRKTDAYPSVNAFIRHKISTGEI